MRKRYPKNERKSERANETRPETHPPLPKDRFLSGLCVASQTTPCADLPVPCLNCTLDTAPLDTLVHNCSFGTTVAASCAVKDDVPCAVGGP